MKLKRIIAGIATFALAMTAAMTPLGSALPLPTVEQEASAATYGDYEYTVLKDGTVEISKYYGSASKVTIPSKIDGKKVTSIGEDAFRGCDSLTSITIPNSVKSIDDDAFIYCSSLKSINIPNSVTSIEDSVFEGCISLTSITIPNSVKSIDDAAFFACKSLTSITIPDSVTSIGEMAFWNCESLTSITIPKSVTSIGDLAFEICSRLSDVYYTGTEAQWKKINVGENNLELLNANIHYNYAATTKVTAVTGLKLKGRAADALRIGSTKNTSADGYIVEMYSGGKWTRVGKITKNATTEWRQSGLAAGTAYKFRVKAYKMNGKTALYSGYVNISARTNPSAVKGVKVLGKAKDALRIGWNKNTSADGYIVEMYKNGSWVRVKKITSNATTQWRQSGLKKGTTYKFRVRAYKMSGKTALYSGYTNCNTATAK